MVMNTQSRSQTNREPIIRMEPVIQNNLQPPLFLALDGGDQDRIAALEAQIESLTQRNAELLQRRLRQPHPEMNRDEHEEERNSHTDSHGCREDDHHEDNFCEVNPRELRNRRPDPNGDLNGVLAELERWSMYMEMERKDKSL
jgi:hypothetical protein